MKKKSRVQGALRSDITWIFITGLSQIFIIKNKKNNQKMKVHCALRSHLGLFELYYMHHMYTRDSRIHHLYLHYKIIQLRRI